MAVRNLTHGSLKIKGGTSGQELTIPIEEGNVRFTVRREARVIMNRGTIQEFSEGDEEPMAVSFGIKFEEWRGKTTSGANPSPPDALRKKGNASSWTSVQTCGPYMVDLEFTMTAPCTTGDQDEVLTFPNFHADEVSFEEGQDYNMLNVTGKCKALEPTSVRS